MAAPFLFDIKSAYFDVNPTIPNALERDELWLIWGPGFPDAVKAAAEKAAHSCGFQKVTWVKTGGVITTHGGPSAFGIVGFTSK